MKARRGLKLGFPVSNQEMVAYICLLQGRKKIQHWKNPVERENEDHG